MTVATERLTIEQVTQLGVETVPGTAVAASKRFPSLSIVPAIKTEIRSFRPTGYKFNTIAAMDKEWSVAKITGFPNYEELAYLMASGLAYAAPTNPVVGGYQYVSTPGISTGDAYKSYTIEHGSGYRAHRSSGNVVNSLAFEYSRAGITVDGEMVGGPITDDIHLSTNATYTLTAGGSPPTAGTFTLTYAGQTTGNINHDATAAAVQTALCALSTVGTGNAEVTATVATGAGNLSVAANVYTIEFVNDLGLAARTLTGTFTSLTASATIALAAGVVGVTPTTLGVKPVLPTQTDLYLADTWAGLPGASALTRGFKAGWSISDRWAQPWPIGTALTNWVKGVENSQVKLTAKLQHVADATGMGMLTKMRAGTTQFMRIKCIGPLILTTTYYTFQTDLALKVVGEPTEMSDQDGLYAIEWNFEGFYDSTSGKTIEVTVINSLSGL